jgi:rhodanese-related sulfurtransferase
VSGGELSALLSGDRRPIVLDVRSSAEYAAGHIQGAVHVPFWAVPWRSARLHAASNDPIVVYCGHGPRALFARSALRHLGFTRVACLAGHMSQWRREGRPEVRG